MENPKENTKHSVKSAICEICNKVISDKNNLKRHMRTHTGEKPYRCEICHKSFSNLAVHRRTHTGEKPHQCEICYKCFKTASDRNKHMNIHTGEKSYSCEICSKVFNKKENMKTHMRLHSGQKPYSCEVCTNRFLRRSDLERHMMTHTGQKRYPCDICKKSFSYIHHKRVHTGEQPFKCQVCNKSFSEKGNLARHVRSVHREEKSYMCKICHKSYSVSRSLKYHLITHAKEKASYGCDICKTAFPTKCGLMCHQRDNHTGMTPYRCVICKNYFCSNGILERHKKTHSGPNLHHCDICMMPFSHKDTLKKHKKTHFETTSSNCKEKTGVSSAPQNNEFFKDGSKLICFDCKEIMIFRIEENSFFCRKCKNSVAQSCLKLDPKVIVRNLNNCNATDDVEEEFFANNDLKLGLKKENSKGKAIEANQNLRMKYDDDNTEKIEVKNELMDFLPCGINHEDITVHKEESSNLAINFDLDFAKAGLKDEMVHGTNFNIIMNSEGDSCNSIHNQDSEKRDVKHESIDDHTDLMNIVPHPEKVKSEKFNNSDEGVDPLESKL